MAKRERKKRPTVKAKRVKVPTPDPEATEHTGNAIDLVLFRNPTIDRSYLSITFFLSEFATDVLGSPPYIVGLFRHYSSLLPSRASTKSQGSLLSSVPVVLAVDALAQGHFGRANADLMSVRQSLQKYGMALRSMSAELAENKIEDSDFRCLSEEDWQNMAFFCIVMTFWEVHCDPPPLSSLRGAGRSKR